MDTEKGKISKSWNPLWFLWLHAWMTVGFWLIEGSHVVKTGGLVFSSWTERFFPFFYDFSLKNIGFSGNFYLFAISKNVQRNREGSHRDGHLVKHMYIVEATEIPVCNDSCSGYKRE